MFLDGLLVAAIIAALAATVWVVFEISWAFGERFFTDLRKTAFFTVVMTGAYCTLISLALDWIAY